MTALKLKACKVCGTEFEPFRSTAVACSFDCAIKHAKNTRKAKELKAFRKETKRRKEAIKTRSQWLKEAQAAFNKFVRIRDAGKPCISSGRPLNDAGLMTGSRIDAGHYRSTGAASHLRFNLFNCHAQSVHDNREKSGNVVEYRIRLIERIGLERVERLEHDNTPRKFDIEYLTRVKSIFTRRAKLYQKLRGQP